jgi:gliding motility-associated-like protein/uncharacterized repeat protein (TIGR01451 family)
VKQKAVHIIILLILLAGTLVAGAQNVRYVQCNTTHPLFVPDNPKYNYEWSMTWGYTKQSINIASTKNVTDTINWNFCQTFYDISVVPVLDSTVCKGEPIKMRVYTVNYLSLHAFDDIFYTQKDDTLHADVSTNDFDENGLLLVYSRDLISQPKHGTATIDNLGKFIYIPNPGFVGIDTFIYEVSNYKDNNPNRMYANAQVTIVVRDKDKLANLYIEKTGPAKALYGAEIIYRILVRNNGPDQAENIIVSDILPFGLYNTTYRINSGTKKPWVGNLNVGNLIANDSVIIYIYADISQFAPEGIYNQGLTYSDIYDSDISDNDSIWFTQISALYVDLPDQLHVPGCDSVKLPNISAGNNKIISYLWKPATGLSDPTIATPVFTPDENTLGGNYPYVLIVTDVNGKTASDTITLIVSDLPVAKIEADTMYRDLGEVLDISGSESTGDKFNYFWWADEKNGKIDGHILDGYGSSDTTKVDSVGFYHLEVKDFQKCTAYDSVLVLLESHPPVALNDYVDIVAGTDSTINVLDNDYDINKFDLRVTRILTLPNHASIFTWDSLGNFKFGPDINYWLWDSLQYEVCNNGLPEMCSSAWMVIHCIRPPLHADVAITKTTDSISFWGDSIRYDITIYSNGPDTASVINLHDEINSGLIFPEFSYSYDNRKTWSQWRPWKNQFDFEHPLIPLYDVIHIKIKAFIVDTHVKGNYNKIYINNKAYITPASDFLEDNYSNDTSEVVSKIKEMVIANAGRDRMIGACNDTLVFDGRKSTGENITYSWSPTTSLDDYTSATPVFDAKERGQGTYDYVLTITDDDGITDTDTMKVVVLPLPTAHAGNDMSLKFGENISPNGTKSTGYNLKFLWNAINNGHIVPGTDISPKPIVDELGTYILKVTDAAGCTATDTMEVYRFYYPPYAIPDYYSTEPNKTIDSNTDTARYRSLIDNDFDPNRLFILNAKPVVNMKTDGGGTVTINSDGSFIYSPKVGFIGVDVFTYEVCNSQYNGCTRGYVKITVANKNNGECNLSIRKSLVKPTVLIGKDLVFKIEIKNSGTTDISDITITDSLSAFIMNPVYSYDPSFTIINNWTGELKKLTLKADTLRSIYIRGKVSTLAPDNRILNAAMVSSPTYDNCFDWYDRETHNVDTSSVYIENNLIVNAVLIEKLNTDNDLNDGIIGICDNRSILSAAKTVSTLGDETYEWLPGEYLTSDSTVETTFNLANISDTTIKFTLIVRSGGKSKFAYVPVTISPKVIVNAGPDKKINEGIPLILNAVTGQGDGAVYTWTLGVNDFNDFENGNPLTPRITSPGMYILYAIDMHGCTDQDTVYIHENQLFALNDIMVVISGKTVMGNVATNDYDPNGDSILYEGVVLSGPLHGILEANPPGYYGINGKNGARISNNGTYIYRSNVGYTGDDYFTYQIHDNNNPDLYVSGKVFIKVINVDSINSPPVANHDVFFVDKNGTLLGDLLANDYDYDGGTITLDLNPVSKPGKGVVTLLTDSTFTYIPDEDMDGVDSFYYRIYDNGKPVRYDTTMVYIYIHKIEGENHKPVAVDDAYYAVVKTITGNLLLNDYDPDGNNFYIVRNATTLPTNGTFNYTDNYGSFEYTPKPGYEGTDMMTYTIKENGTAEEYSTTATVYFTSLLEKRYHTDLIIAKSGPPYILSGNMIQYAISATDNGPTLVNNVVISDTLFSKLSKIQYSDDGGVKWQAWKGTYKIDRMKPYDENTILIRAQSPDSIWFGLPDSIAVILKNTAWVSHNMTESNPENNDSTWKTIVYQKVYAEAANDTLIGSCITKYTLDGTGSIGMGDLKYNWSLSGDLNNANLSRPIYSTTPGEIQKFTLVVSSDYNGLFPIGKDTDEVWVEISEAPVANAGPDFWDVTDTITLDGSKSKGYGPLTYSWWYYDKEKQVKVIDSTMITKVFFSGTFYLTITDKFGCKNTDEMHIGLLIDPFIAVDDTITTSQQVPTVCIKVLSNDIIDPEDSYNLSTLVVYSQPKHGTITEDPNDSCFIYTPEQYFIGNDTFAYIVSTTHSFSNDAKVIIRVLPKPAIVPEGFSPNGDGINDVLIIENIEKYELNSLIIFNRWGSLVYKKERYSNSEPWDGIANKGIRIGQGPVPAGVYLYILDLGDDKVNRTVDGVLVNNRIVKGNIYVASEKR